MLNSLLNIYTFPVFILSIITLLICVKHKMVTVLGIIFMIVLLDKFISINKRSKKTVVISEENNIEILPENQIPNEENEVISTGKYCINTQLTNDGLFQLPLEEDPKNKKIMDMIVNDSLFDNLLEVEFTKKWLEKYPMFQQLNFIHGASDTINQIIKFYQ
jgi:hypothetical protein